MISKILFQKKQNLDALLKRYSEIYAIESEMSDGLIYCISDGKFAIMRRDGVAFCPIHEIPKMAEMMKYPQIKDEILDIYADYKQLKRMDMAIG